MPIQGYMGGKEVEVIEKSGEEGGKGNPKATLDEVEVNAEPFSSHSSTTLFS